MNSTIVILEDHPIFAAGMKDLVEQLLPSANVLCISRLTDLLQQIKVMSPHVVLADMHLPDGDGINMMTTIRQAAPNALVMGITGDERLIEVNRNNPMREFVVISKMAPFDHMLDEIQNHIKRSNVLDKNDAMEMVNQNSYRNFELDLTKKQQMVLNFMRQGLSNKEIAKLMNVSPETVKTHAKDVYGRLGIKNRTQAASIAKRLSYSTIFLNC